MNYYQRNEVIAKNERLDPPEEHFYCECGEEMAWDDQMCEKCKQIIAEEKMNKEISKEVVVMQPSPAVMIQEAVTKGTDLEKLKGLLELQERWEANEARKAYHKAMSDFKANPPKINKDKKVGFKTSAGQVGYSHASLANVTDKINQELSKHDLSASWRTQQNGKIVVTCRITHAKGHSEETSLSADADNSGAKNPIQAIGSTISYLERYTLLALTGLATFDQDDDGIKAGLKPEVKMPQAMESPNKANIVENLPIEAIKVIEELGKIAFKGKKQQFVNWVGAEFGIETLAELKSSQYAQATSKLNEIIKNVKQ